MDADHHSQKLGRPVIDGAVGAIATEGAGLEGPERSNSCFIRAIRRKARIPVPSSHIRTYVSLLVRAAWCPCSLAKARDLYHTGRHSVEKDQPGIWHSGSAEGVARDALR